MFKKMRLMQIGFCCLVLAGCASSHTTTQQANSKTTISLRDNTTAPITPLVKALDVHPKNGSSIEGRQDYFQADGSLSHYLQEWVDELIQLHGLSKEKTENLIKSARYNAQAARLMAPSKGRIKRSWSTYKSRFIEPIRIQAGLDFWKEYDHIISPIAQQYGVPSEIIVSIIGVETIYGRYTGDFKVLDALLTLGFSYPDNSRPERGQLFRDQLADFIVLHQQQKIDAYSATGSFAGAMGLPQFMPGSLMRYAVDADGDGKIDLYQSIPDIVASVANFLVVHGWQKDLTVFAPVKLKDAQAKSLVDGGLIPKLNWQQIQQAQAVQTTVNTNSAWTQQPLGVIDLVEQSQGTAEYRLATPNFFVITAYNRSYFYATTVSDFAELLAARFRS